MIRGHYYEEKHGQMFADKGMHLNVLKDIAVSLVINEMAHFCYSYLCVP